MALYADLDALRASAADVRIVTSDGQSIAAHSYVLVSPTLSCSPDRLITFAFAALLGC